MKIVIYSSQLRKVSGVQTFELALIQALIVGKTAESITLVYESADKERLEMLKADPWIETRKNDGKEITCDICIYSTVFRSNAKNIKAKKYIQVLHTVLSDFNIKYKPEGVDYHVCVSKQVEEDFKKLHPEVNNSIIINNINLDYLVYRTQSKPVLRLLVASRIAPRKGFNKLFEFCSYLKEKGIDFVLEIYGGSLSVHYLKKIQKLFSVFPEVHFMGERMNIPSYYAGINYIVQLSKSEGYCYSIHEALARGIPVIVSNWSGAEEVVKHGVNGYIISREDPISQLDEIDLFRPFDRDAIKTIYNVEESNRQACKLWYSIL